MTSTKPGFAERLSYGLGDLGFSLPYNMASGFLLYYYVSIVKLPAAAVGTIFLIARLMDAVIDVAVGIAVDRTRSRWGRTRGYFLFMAIPYAIVFITVFSVPDGGRSAQIIYAFLTFKALGILMSLGSIPYTALMPMMTADPDARLKLSGMRSIGTSVSVIIGTAATTPLVGILGGGDERRGFLGTAMLFAVISLIAITALFRNCRERVEDDAPPKFPVMAAAGEMLRNRAWWVTFGMCLFYFIRFGGMMAITPYFAIEVLGKPWMISVMMPAISGMLLLSSFIAPPYFSLMGLRVGCVAALAVAALLFVALPFTEPTPPLFIAIYMAACVTTSVTITATFAMIAGAIDRHERHFGARREGLLSAGASLATKLGMAVGTAGIAYLLGYFDYTPGSVTDTSRTAIRWTYYGGTVLLIGVQASIILLWPAQEVSTPGDRPDRAPPLDRPAKI